MGQSCSCTSWEDLAHPKGPQEIAQAQISDRSHLKRMWSVTVAAQRLWQVQEWERRHSWDAAFRESPFFFPRPGAVPRRTTASGS